MVINECSCTCLEGVAGAENIGRVVGLNRIVANCHCIMSNQLTLCILITLTNLVHVMALTVSINNIVN